MVAQMGKHHQTHMDDNQGHILLTHYETDGDEPWIDSVPIEYFTDSAGQVHLGLGH